MIDPSNRSKLSLNRESKRTGPDVEERLHKVLAMAGIGSRRLLEERIVAGEIRINGSVAETGALLRSGDRVELDGKAFMAVAATPDDLHLAIYHKPEGEVTTHDDPEGRPTVFEKFPPLSGARWVSIGRLDINTTGLLLLTSDGELANAMMHPSAALEREYVCRVHGPVDEAVLQRLRDGVVLEDGPARFDEIAVINLGDSHSWFRVILREGRNREVRRLWESQNLSISRLKRIRYGSVELPRELRRGRFEILPLQRLTALRAELGLGELPQTLTLQAVVGVRRAAKPNEFLPAERSQRAWTGATADEGRELRAFDHIRDDSPRRAKRPFTKGAPRTQSRRGPGRASGTDPQAHAQRPVWLQDSGTTAPRGRGVPRGGRPQRPGQPGAEWASRGPQDPNRAPPRRSDGNRPQRPFDPNRPARVFDPNRPPRADMHQRPARSGAARPPRGDHADQPPRSFDPARPARSFDANRPARPFDPNRAPPRARPSVSKGGFGARTGAENDGNRQRGNPAERRTWSAGAPPNRGPRPSGGPATPYGFPSDHAYAQRTHGNQRDDLGNRKPDASRGQERRGPPPQRGNAPPSAPRAAPSHEDRGNRSERPAGNRPRRPGGPPNRGPA